MPFVQLSLILNSIETSLMHYKKHVAIFYACGLTRSSLLLRSTEVSHFFLQSINTMRLIFLVSLYVSKQKTGTGISVDYIYLQRLVRRPPGITFSTGKLVVILSFLDFYLIFRVPSLLGMLGKLFLTLNSCVKTIYNSH